MIAYMKGTVAQVSPQAVVLEVNGIGYEILISATTAERLSMGREVMIHTHFQVREDAMQLYGFLDKSELQLFGMLIGVNGIGPKAALSILGTMPYSDLQFAILAEDAKAISKAPGIGKKTAQKLILELKDKMSLEEAFEERIGQAAQETTLVSSDAKGEAVQALVALGYSGADALKAVNAASATEEMDAEQILKAALKNLAFL